MKIALIIAIAIIVVLFILVLVLRKKAISTVKYNASIERENKALVDINIMLKAENKELSETKEQFIISNQELERKLEDTKERIRVQDNVLRSVSSSAENAKKAADAQAEALQKARIAAETELKNIKDSQTRVLNQELEQRRKQQDEEFERQSQERSKQLEEEFSKKRAAAEVEVAKKREIIETELNARSLALINDIELKQAQLNDLEAKQLAYVQAKQREEEIAAQKDYYRPVINAQAISEIGLLRGIQMQFTRKDAIDKLIWEVYYKAAYDELMSHIFTDNSKTCGIYKITNLENEQAYIGQSVDMRERFRQHIKAGLSSSSASNKLYQQMKKYGPENFTFEILEIVDRDKLNERETYWIDFYKTKEYGLNGTRGGA